MQTCTDSTTGRCIVDVKMETAQLACIHSEIGQSKCNQHQNGKGNNLVTFPSHYSQQRKVDVSSKIASPNVNTSALFFSDYNNTNHPTSEFILQMKNESVHFAS